jgi:hypothetical protein
VLLFQSDQLLRGCGIVQGIAVIVGAILMIDCGMGEGLLVVVGVFGEGVL